VAVEESVLIAEASPIVCIFRKEDLMMIGAKVISGERQIALKQNNGLIMAGQLRQAVYLRCCFAGIPDAAVAKPGVP